MGVAATGTSFAREDVELRLASSLSIAGVVTLCCGKICGGGKIAVGAGSTGELTGPAKPDGCTAGPPIGLGVDCGLPVCPVGAAVGWAWLGAATLFVGAPLFAVGADCVGADFVGVLGWR